MKRPANQCPLAAAALARPLDDARARGLLLLDARDGRLFERSTGVRGRHRLPGPSPSPPPVVAFRVAQRAAGQDGDQSPPGRRIRPAPPARPLRRRRPSPATAHSRRAVTLADAAASAVPAVAATDTGAPSPARATAAAAGTPDPTPASASTATSGPPRRRWHVRQAAQSPSPPRGPLKVPGATKDGSPWHPPSSRRGGAPAIRAMRRAARRPPRRASSRSLPSTA